MPETLIEDLMPSVIYMRHAWACALHITAGKDEAIAAFREATGYHWTPGRTPLTLSGTENYWYCSRDACAGKKLVDLRAEIERLQQQSEAQHKSYGEVVGRLNAAEAVWDSWRRTAERLEGENARLQARVAALEDIIDLSY